MASRLGDRIDPDTVFAQIATEVLSEVPAPSIDVLAMADWAAQQHPLPQQVNFKSGFGQPPLVVFVAPGFYIEVLFWFPSRTGIHGHGFTGAFRVLSGCSVQVEYRFLEESAPMEGLRLGKLVPQGIEMIAPGKICSILGRDDFIHCVAHLGNPSLTLVARTYGSKDLRQFAFRRCGFAVRAKYQKQTVERQAAVLAAVYKARPAVFLERLMAYLGTADLATFYLVLGELESLLTLSVFTKLVLPAVRERFGASHAPALAALEEDVRSSGIWGLIGKLVSPRQQLQLALGELFPDESQRDALICQSLAVSDAKPVLEAWLQTAEQAAAPADAA
ncbi:MAG: hypothetical protein EBS05_05700 [Proteobacteria bacterium]|nr:hypothetical protein [Pseudomonadota bacterium]